MTPPAADKPDTAQHAIADATKTSSRPVQTGNDSNAVPIGSAPENGVFGAPHGPNRQGKPS